MHVFFATPSFAGPAKPYLESLDRTVAALHARGDAVSAEMVGGDCYVQRARNTLVAHFLRTDATHLFFLDDDLDWPAEAVLKLIDAGLPVTFGAYPMKDDKGEDYPVVLNVDLHTYQPLGRADGWLSASGAPAGFLCVTREAILHLRDMYPERAFDDWDRATGAEKGRAWDLFPQGVNHGRWWGEDYGFCNLWTFIGGMIWCWPDIDFGHTDRRTGKRYVGNYDRYLRSLPKKDEAA